MFAMFNQLYAGITVLGAAFEMLAKALFHLCKTAEMEAKAFADESAVANEAKLLALKHGAAAQARALTLE